MLLVNVNINYYALIKTRFKKYVWLLFFFIAISSSCVSLDPSRNSSNIKIYLLQPKNACAMGRS